MLFTDTLFLFYFLPFALLLHRLCLRGGKPGRYGALPQACLFILTVIFYASGQLWWIVPFFVCIGFDFLWANLVYRAPHPRLRQFFCFCSIAQNLLLLGFFKYAAFLKTNLTALSPSLGQWVPQVELNGPFPLPAGISFYTFESLSFVIDIYRGKIAPPQRPLDFFAFIGMFPRFIAGPIVRYSDLEKQFHRYPGMQIEEGLLLFMKGFFLKSCLADSFAALVPYAFGPVTPVATGAAWIGVIAYTLQIYFDFSGYSLMAIGLGRCFGFQFPENFNQPYQATSLQDFWRRWHISLSTWLRDYVYLSLGGNRGGRWATLRNLFLTMLIGGLWHGATWNFVLWGAWHGGLLAIERRFPSPSDWVGRVRTLLSVMIGWVLFRAADLPEAGRILRALFIPNAVPFNHEGLATNGIALGFCALGIGLVVFKEQKLHLWFARKASAAVLFVIGLLYLLSANLVPFLYFQF